MPWKECSAVEERLRFIARRLEGESMADLCREFGISRKTGYKIFAITASPSPAPTPSSISPSS
ncbi:MAG TPA: helix-turn-helix domain-containing protein, partial [Hyphomicrobiaceae bacterium]|nr:helix-turn-helix domain-containing protein [Hyphomicrobiaceae bacterium]